MPDAADQLTEAVAEIKRLVSAHQDLIALEQQVSKDKARYKLVVKEFINWWDEGESDMLSQSQRTSQLVQSARDAIANDGKP